MTKDTKNLIYETFIDLLGTKPFDRITVRDIVEACDINRNTFYYYYSDIYELLEEMFKKELNELLEAQKNGGSWITAFLRIANTAYSHKKQINNICASQSYEYLENYMYKALQSIVLDIVRHMAEGMTVPEADIEFIASFFEYAFVGVISEWFRTGMREDPLQFANQLWLIVDNIRFALRRSEKRMKIRIDNDDIV